MSNDDTPNIVFLKINITDKSIVGIGPNPNNIDILINSIPISGDMQDQMELQKKLNDFKPSATVDGTTDQNELPNNVNDLNPQATDQDIISLNITIDQAIGSPKLSESETGRLIQTLAKTVNENENLPDNVGDLRKAVEEKTPVAVPKHVEEGGGKIIGSYADQIETKLGKEIYETWKTNYKKKFKLNIKTMWGTIEIPKQHKQDMVKYINELTNNHLPKSEVPSSRWRVGEIASSFGSLGNTLTPVGLGGKNVKYTKRKKTNRRRKTKRRQSRNT